MSSHSRTFGESTCLKHSKDTFIISTSFRIYLVNCLKNMQFEKGHKGRKREERISLVDACIMSP